MRRIAQWILVSLCLVGAIGTGPGPARGQEPAAKPYALPLKELPGPTTWLLSQPFGNTVGAYNFGKYWYAGGQGLHFGIDFWTPCGTPVHVIADGVVDQVDNQSFGLEPHNLTIFHPQLGSTSVYGHLSARPTVSKGQPVRQGDQVAFTGDPERTCTGRPHLHLEIRNTDYGIAYNPIPLIEADWPMLSSIGYQGFGGFIKDLYAPKRWQAIDDQPVVDFNEAPLNSYREAWPPYARNAPPPETLTAYTAPAIPPAGTPKFRQITNPGCCSEPWWSPDGKFVRYWDGPEGQLASLISMPVNGEPPQVREKAAPRLYSSDGKYEIQWTAGRVTIVRLADNTAFPVAVGGAWPRFSPGNGHILWHRHPDDAIPGSIQPQTEIWIANPDGTGRVLVRVQPGGAVYWLDEGRLLIGEAVGRNDEIALKIYTIASKKLEALLTVRNLRGLAVAPGGAQVLFYAPFQEEPTASGIYLLETQPGKVPAKLPFFGSYRWRDSTSIVYIPYQPGPMSFVLYDVTTGQARPLTDPSKQPFVVANDDWSVAPGAQHIVFWNHVDRALWLVELPR